MIELDSVRLTTYQEKKPFISIRHLQECIETNYKIKFNLVTMYERSHETRGYLYALQAVEFLMDQLSLIRGIVEWIVEFIIDFIAPWILDRGGWVSVS